MTQAGLDMDLCIWKKIGPRGFVMALTGSILPIAMGMFLSKFVLGQSGSTVIAMGCCFGPTSAGIALNVLGSLLETPLGQLIVAAAIVDDLIALLVLSQLEALTGDGAVSVAQVAVPIVSAFGWLFVGGALALIVVPKVHHVLWNRAEKSGLVACIAGPDRNSFSLTALVALLFGLLPATFYSQASYLLGAFLAGLSFCQEPSSLSASFRAKFKRIIGWLMKLFFAAAIGFQVPLSEFGDFRVVRNGCILFLSLFGKLAVGPLLTPKFEQEGRRWRGHHLRDCAVVGLSMAGEAEFAFVVAVFGVTEQLIPPDLYASVVLAILLSTIVSPLLLRTVLTIFPVVNNDKVNENRNANIVSLPAGSERMEQEETS